MNSRMTIYEVLRAKLGREPSHAEIKADIKRILASMTTEKSMVVRAGSLAYVDTMSGLIPCKVLKVHGPAGYKGRATSAITIDVRLTANRGPWRTGELIKAHWAIEIIPRGCVLHRKYGKRILTGYHVEVTGETCEKS